MGKANMPKKLITILQQLLNFSKFAIHNVKMSYNCKPTSKTRELGISEKNMTFLREPIKQ